MKLLAKSALRASAADQAKSASFFIKLRSTPEGDLMPPMEANLLIVIVRTVRSIDENLYNSTETVEKLFYFDPLTMSRYGKNY